MFPLREQVEYTRSDDATMEQRDSVTSSPTRVKTNTTYFKECPCYVYNELMAICWSL